MRRRRSENRRRARAPSRARTRHLALLAALAVLVPAACRRGGTPPGESSPPAAGAGARVEPVASGGRSAAGERARREIAELVRGMNHGIDTWDGPAYLAGFARSDSLVFIGSDSTEITLGYDSLAPGLLKGFARARAGGRSGSYRHTGLTAGATSDGRAGWWVQEMEYRFERDGRLLAYPFRISGFALRGGNRWRAYLAHASLPVPPDSLHRLFKPFDREPPSSASGVQADVPGRGVAARSAAGLESLARLLASRYEGRSGSAHAWLDLFAPEPDVQVIGEAPGDVHVGRPAAENASRTAPAPGIRFDESPPLVRVLGDAGWWYEAHRVRLRLGSGSEVVLTRRSTGAAVWRDGAWRVVQWHSDVPVPNDSTALFSHPVAGSPPIRPPRGSRSSLGSPR